MRFGMFDFFRRNRIFVPEPEPEEDELTDTKHSRRFFFGIMAGAAVSAIVVPSLMGHEQSAIPELVPCGNKLLTVQQVTDEALKILAKNLTFVASASQPWRSAFHTNEPQTIRVPSPWNNSRDGTCLLEPPSGARRFDAATGTYQSKIGDTLNIRRPLHFPGMVTV